MSLGPNDVAEGFRADCVRLIGKFEQLETVRFEGFCDIWRDMKFPLVFVGRKSMVELLEFCEDSLVIGKDFFLPPFSFKERIGGLYLLYGIYFKMPIKGPKIRVKFTDWQDILEFQAEVAQAEHHDASYILSRLMSENAFSHCLFQRELGLEKSYRMRACPSVNPYSVLPEIRELAGPRDLFDRIKSLSAVYELSKKRSVNTSTANSSGLQWYDSKFGEKLLDAVKQLENSRKVDKSSNARPVRSRDDLRGGPFAGVKKKPAGKVRLAPDVIRTRLGHGFDTDSSDSQNEDDVDPLEIDQTLPDLVDCSSSSD